MSGVPPETRGVSSGMRATFQNSANLVCIVTVELASALPSTLSTGLITNSVPGKAALAIAHLPPTAALFGAFLGYNPIGELLPPAVLQTISPTHRAVLLGKSFFPITCHRASVLVASDQRHAAASALCQQKPAHLPLIALPSSYLSAAKDPRSG